MTVDIKQLAEDLRGTCKSPEDFGVDFCELTEQECAELDELVLECTQCGWWVESGDTHESEGGEVICGQCKGEE